MVDVQRKNFGIDEAIVGVLRQRILTGILRFLDIEPGTRTADLGAGPCVFAKLAAEAGLAVTAVDARTERLPDPPELGSIDFVQADIRDFDLMDYEVIMILGLLYHLEIPDQIDLLKRSNGARHVILDTQVHIPELVNTPHPDRFSDLQTTKDGYEGVAFFERDNPMASITNSSSFWHTEESMMRLFDAAGYSEVVVVDPPYQSIHGGRRFYVISGRDA